LKAKRNRIKTR